MASTFYARYVPPTKVASLENGPSRISAPPRQSKKRTRDEAETEQPKTSKKSKKNKARLNEDNGAVGTEHSGSKGSNLYRNPPNVPPGTKKTKLTRKKADERPSKIDDRAQSDVHTQVPNKLPTKGSEKSKRTRHDLRPDGRATLGATDLTTTATNNGGVNDKGGRVEEEQPNSSKGRVKRRATKLDHVIQEAKDDRDLDSRHAVVREKFQKSLKKSKKVSERLDQQADLEVLSDEPLEAHGLVPLPQPPLAPEPDKPSFSGLPSWIALPLHVSLNDRKPFAELNIHHKLLAILRAKGYDEAFAVQTAVIPLLLRGPRQYNGDICISAATGSGKTLAYVLPMIESLRDRVVIKLRGVIVVPTRELVQQAREVCELCASGTGLQIGTAIGSKLLKDEQDMIVKTIQRYDPRKYQEQYKRPASDVDWATFNLQDLLTSVEEPTDPLPDHVMGYSSKVDILICTPGRLVNHIRSTKGFSLGLVQWLIIDEADRLLNESFQEWVDVVIPALELESPQSDLGELQQFLSGMNLEVPRPELRKIICSATLTRDITKLNSLKLKRPQLVAVGQGDSSVRETGEPELADESGIYNLPSSLQEYAITVADESLKPLYLLNLLLHRIDILGGVNSSSRRKVSSGTKEEAGMESQSSDSDSNSSSTSSSSSSSDTSSNASSSSSESAASSPAKSSSPPSQSPAPVATKPTVLIFTSSTAATHRLTRLLTTLHPTLVPHITTITRIAPSQKAIVSLLSPTSPIRIAIATDRASRGLDIPFLGHVVSYDVPTSLTGYVHRVGRTARAGREGKAWNLVSWREGKWWWNSIGKDGVDGMNRGAKVKRVKIEVEMGEAMKREYEEALVKLGEDVKGEGHEKKKA